MPSDAGGAAAAAVDDATGAAAKAKASRTAETANITSSASIKASSLRSPVRSLTSEGRASPKHRQRTKPHSRSRSSRLRANPRLCASPNRLLRGNNLAQEAVICDFLARLCEGAARRPPTRRP